MNTGKQRITLVSLLLLAPPVLGQCPGPAPSATGIAPSDAVVMVDHTVQFTATNPKDGTAPISWGVEAVDGTRDPHTGFIMPNSSTAVYEAPENASTTRHVRVNVNFSDKTNASANVLIVVQPTIMVAPSAVTLNRARNSEAYTLSPQIVRTDHNSVVSPFDNCSRSDSDETNDPQIVAAVVAIGWRKRSHGFPSMNKGIRTKYISNRVVRSEAGAFSLKTGRASYLHAERTVPVRGLFYQLHIRRAVSATSLSLAHCWSSVMRFPSIVEAKPH
jgi:hypothetical protein